VRDDVERRLMIGQGFEQHAGVLLQGPADAEMIEGEYAISVGRAHAIEEVSFGKAAVRQRGARKRAVDEEQ
jgi:hypothetical protein